MDAAMIEQVLGTKLKFSPRHNTENNLAAYCPFHKDGEETKPSFYIYYGPTTSEKTNGSAFCHACPKGWRFEGLLRDLKLDLGTIHAISEHIRLEEEDTFIPTEEQKESALNFNGLFVLPDTMLGAWHYQPKALSLAGFSDKTLLYYDIGYDRAARRITFPVRDHHGRLVGVSGRAAAGIHPKYKIYRSEFKSIHHRYELKKNLVLWGLDKFYYDALAGKRIDYVIVCEGFKAAMWLAQAGYPHVVALFGTSLSDHQRRLLVTITQRVVLFLDNNESGIRGTYKANKFLKDHLIVNIAQYPEWCTDKTQPDDIPPAELDGVIKHALPMYSWRRRNEYVPYVPDLDEKD